ncbi:MAG TPA: DUF2232 domain-containing protein [Syntrophales bacterium]|nr:DUF2232 domain-containing protein [Syntrophales bacterium]
MEKQRSGFLSGSFLRELVLASLAVLLVALAPFVGAIVLIFIPLPVLFYYSKNGRARGLAFLAVALSIAALVAANIFHASNALPPLVIIALLGIIMAEAMKRGYSIEKTVWSSVLAISILGGLFVLYQSILQGEAPWRLIQLYAERRIRTSIDFYTYLNISSETLKPIKENIAGIAAFIAGISPAIAVVSLAFVVWVNLLMGRAVFQKYGLPYHDFGNLSHWKPPEKMVWYLIAAGVMLLLPDNRTEFIGWNILIVILYVYLLAGLAIVSFFLKKSAVPAVFRYPIYFLIFAQQVVTMSVVAAGIFDLWVDFRKLKKTMEDSTV